MRRVNIELLCDACDSEGAPEAAAEHNVLLAIGPSGRKSIDLCDRHHKVMVQPLLDLIASHAADPEDVGAPAAAAPRQHGDGGGPWVCTVCGKSLNWRKSAITHMVQAHKISEADASHKIPPKSDPHECPICGYLAAGRQGLGSHHAFAHADRPPATPGEGIACPKCSEVLPSRDAFKTHAISVHNASPKALLEPDRAMACPTCGYLATAPQGLTSHMNRTHG